MGQVRYNFIEKEKNRVTSIYIGEANSVASARQVVIENIDKVEEYQELAYGNIYFDTTVIG
jgi:hypothetical protein